MIISIHTMIEKNIYVYIYTHILYIYTYVYIYIYTQDKHIFTYLNIYIDMYIYAYIYNANRLQSRTYNTCPSYTAYSLAIGSIIRNWRRPFGSRPAESIKVEKALEQWATDPSLQSTTIGIHRKSTRNPDSQVISRKSPTELTCGWPRPCDWDGWGQQRQRIFFCWTCRRTSCRHAVKFFTDYGYWWKW